MAVLQGEDFDNRNELIAELSSRMSPYTSELPLPEGYISIAHGISKFSPETDRTVQDVIKRADERMYENKAKMKGLR